jgi:quinoprotein glucose dehydrogenase
MKKLQKIGVSTMVSAIAVLGLSPAFAANTPNYKEWAAWGGTQNSMHYSSLKQITKANVSDLQPAWKIDVGGQVASPIVADGVLYGIGDGGIFAADVATGRKLWANTAAAPVGRGVGMYWKSANDKDKRIIYYTGLGFAELNATTGELITTIGDKGVVDMRQGLDRDPQYLRAVRSGNPGRIFGDLVILGSATGEGFNSPPGDIRAWNIKTGELTWTFHTVPRPGEPEYGTWGKDWNWKAQGGVNTWGEITLDDKTGIIYLPVASPTVDFVTADHPGNSLYSNTVLALDARTGKHLWHYQTVHHDLWDYDNTAAPKLLTVVANGKKVEAVAQLGKTGFIYTLDRKTGKPVWPIEERPVPQTDVPGEVTSPTQPFPTRPEPFAIQSFTMDDIGPTVTAETRAELLAKMPTYRNEGIFTPPSRQGSVQMPGNHGGAQYATSAVNPETNMLYLTTVEVPAILTVTPRNIAPRGPIGPSVAGAMDGQGVAGPPAASAGPSLPPVAQPALPNAAVAAPPRPTQPPLPIDPNAPKDPSPWTMVGYGFVTDGAGGGVLKQPWSSLVAYDMSQGKKLWSVPFGNTLAAEAAGLKDRGVVMQKQTISLTAGGLLFSVTQDRKFRAFDASNGAVLMERAVPGAGAGLPAIFEVKGKQYVLIATAGTRGAGGRGAAAPGAPSDLPGSYTAYALPN